MDTRSITLRLDGNLLNVAKDTVSSAAQAVQDSHPTVPTAIANAITTGEDLMAQANDNADLYNAIKELLPSLEGFNEIARLVSEVSPHVFFCEFD